MTGGFMRERVAGTASPVPACGNGNVGVRCGGFHFPSPAPAAAADCRMGNAVFRKEYSVPWSAIRATKQTIAMRASTTETV
jgi:hypothetical protein